MVLVKLEISFSRNLVLILEVWTKLNAEIGVLGVLSSMKYYILSLLPCCKHMELLVNAAHCIVRGEMIECMSTVILPGCGPEVCVTSNNTALPWDARLMGPEADTGEEKKNKCTERREGWKQKADRGKRYPLKLENCSSNLKWSALVLKITTVTSAKHPDGWGIPHPVPISPSFCLSEQHLWSTHLTQAI